MWQPQGIYNEYVLRTPALLIGEEAVRGLYNYPAARIAVIHGSSFPDRDLLQTVFRKKQIRFLLRSWRGEPDFEGLSGTLRELEDFAPDTVIAAGGGAVMDGAKLCRLLYEMPFFVPGITKPDGSLLKTKFIAIPTTVGSGAEVSSAAVYLEGCKKEMVVLHELQPDVVVYDKRYVENTPGRLLAASAMDAMSHVLEGFVSNIQNAMNQIQAEEALRLLRVELQKLCEDRAVDFQRLQYAGYLGGIVQNHCIVGACHAIAHQLAEYGFSHGEAVALLLPAVIHMNAKDEETKRKYEKISGSAGFGGIEELVGWIRQICAVSGINDRKKELEKLLNANRSNTGFLDRIKQDRGGKGNPVEITDGYLTGLIRSI